ncbi:acyltransferase family protein [Paraburkholderia xenovorans]
MFGNFLKVLTMRRIPALDGIRALAAFSVLIAHLFTQNTILWRSLQFARFGVVAFFVLSGYLIINLLLQARTRIEAGSSVRAEWTSFYVRRALRVFVLYYGVVAAFRVVGYGPILSKVWWHVAYASNFGYALFRDDFGNLSHFWSLCIEEQFYVVIPAIVLRLPARRSFAVLCAVFAACMSFKFAVSLTSHDVALLARLPFSNVEGIAAGGCIAYAHRLTAVRSAIGGASRFLAIPALAGTIGLALYRIELGNQVYATTIYMIAIDLVFAMTVLPLVSRMVFGTGCGVVRSMLEFAPLRHLGTISYGTYVYHYALLPFFPVVYRFMGINPTGFETFFCAIGLAHLVSAISWHAIEKPVLALKDKLSLARLPKNSSLAN